MKTAKIGAIFLIAIMALAGTSAGYAMWKETLFIDGTVNTGNLDAAWSVEECGDSETPVPEKDFSSISARIEGYTLIVTLTDAYPCIDYWVNVNIENTGTLPFHIYWDGIIEAAFPGTVTFTPNPDGLQIHPGPENAWYGTLTIHLNNDAEELTIYTFTTDLVVHQWNEQYPQ